MKKIQFYLVAIAFTALAILSVTAFFIVFSGITMGNFQDINLGALAAFDIVFWAAGYILALVVRDCWDEYQEDMELHPEKYNK